MKIKNEKLKLNIQYFAQSDAEVKFKVVLDDNNANKQLQDLSDKGKTASNTISKIGSIGKKTFKALSIGITTASSAFVGLIAYGVKYNAEIERLNTSFEVMTGSAEEAEKITKKLKKLGASTPFETKDLAEVTQLLMQYGETAENAIDKMSMLGDISQGNTEKMKRIAMAYGQMSSANKVALEDVKQMIEAGFNPLKEISDSTGESMASLYDRISKGTISVDEITQSMKRSTSVGGKYFKSMEKQSKTLSGQVSTLKDNFSSLAGTLANDVSGKISSSILPEINQLISDMETAFQQEGIPKMIEVMSSGVVDMLVSLVEQLPSFIDTGSMIIDSLITGISSNRPVLVTSIVETISNLVTEIFSMLPQFLQLGIEIITELVNGIAIEAPELIPEIVETILKLFGILTSQENLDRIAEAGVTLIGALIQGMINSIPKLFENSETTLKVILNVLSGGQLLMQQIGWALIKALIKGIGEFFEDVKKKAKELLDSFIAKLKEGFNDAKEKGKEIVSNIVKGIQEKIKDMKEVGKQLMNGLWQGLQDKWNGLKNSVKNFGNGIINKFKDVFGIHSPSKVMFEIGGYLDEGFINGIKDMEKDIDKQIDSTFGSGLDYLYNGYDNFSAGLPDSSYASIPMQTIYLNNENSNSSILQVDGRVLAETVNTYNNEREVAV